MCGKCTEEMGKDKCFLCREDRRKIMAQEKKSRAWITRWRKSLQQMISCQIMAGKDRDARARCAVKCSTSTIIVIQTIYIRGLKYRNSNTYNLLKQKKSYRAAESAAGCKKDYFSNFSCMFLNPNIFFQFEF